MNVKQIATLLATVLFAAVAYAGEKGHRGVEVVVISDDSDGETRLMLDSDDLGFNLHDMQVGENRSIVDKDGRSILITRGEDSYSFDVDGKTIEMPLFDSNENMALWAPDADHTSTVDVRVMHDGTAPNVMIHDEGVMIFSGKEIDEATQKIIRTALESAGHESVHFAGGEEGGPHQVRVIKKVVEIEE